VPKAVSSSNEQALIASEPAACCILQLQLILCAGVKVEFVHFISLNI